MRKEMKSRRKIPAQDPGGWNKATMVHRKLLLLTSQLPAKAIRCTHLRSDRAIAQICAGIAHTHTALA